MEDWHLEFGTQGDNESIAASLQAAGVLSMVGIDGGDASGNGGTIFAINKYGESLLKHGLADDG